MLLIEIMFEGKLLLQTAFMSVRCFCMTVKVSLLPVCPCGRGFPVTWKGRSWLRWPDSWAWQPGALPVALVPECVADPPQFRDFFCSIKGIITNGQA